MPALIVALLLNVIIKFAPVTVALVTLTPFVPFVPTAPRTLPASTVLVLLNVNIKLPLPFTAALEILTPVLP